MPIKPNINLYNIQVPKSVNPLIEHKKPVAKLKIALFSLLAITTVVSIGQSFSSFDTKTSFANEVAQSSLSSISVNSKSKK
jgi:hypothetical protein